METSRKKTRGVMALLQVNRNGGNAHTAELKKEKTSAKEPEGGVRKEGIPSKHKKEKTQKKKPGRYKLLTRGRGCHRSCCREEGERNWRGKSIL